MTTHPHPLAIEAANVVIHSYVENATSEEGEHIALIIQTTALDPVMKAGDEMADLLEFYCATEAKEALLNWRNLTKQGSDATPKVDSLPSGLPSDESEGVDSGKEARKGFWQPIETAPKDGTVIDLWSTWPGADCKPQRITNCCWEFERWNHRSAFTWISPTHWMPLPTSPDQ